ncbi:MAG: hypothetical protein V5A46_02005 [Haloferacaceae archaeon]
MSGSTQPSTGRLAAPVNPGAAAERIARRVRKTIRVAAFWGAIGLPLAYVPVLHEGIAGQRVDLFLLLLVVHVACIVIGHGRGLDAPSRTGAGDPR